MKKIYGIDEKLQDTINESDKKAEGGKFRFLYRAVISNHVAESGIEAMEYVEVGLKLGVDGADIELEDAEFNKIKNALDKNPLKWPAAMVGQLYKKLVDSEKKYEEEQKAKGGK